MFQRGSKDRFKSVHVKYPLVRLCSKIMGGSRPQTPPASYATGK